MTGSLLPGAAVLPRLRAGAGALLPGAVPAPLVGSHGHPVWSEWGALDWTIVAVGGLISLWVIWRAVQHTFRPGEAAPDHVKRSILEDEDRALATPPGTTSAGAPPAPDAPPPPASASPPARPTPHR